MAEGEDKKADWLPSGSLGKTGFGLGAFCVITAIVGGGLSLRGFEIPVIGSWVRQLLLGLFGLGVLGLAIWRELASGERRVRTGERRLDAAIPKDVAVGEPTEVRVQICSPSSPGFTKSLRTEPLAGEIGREDVRSGTAALQFPLDDEGRPLPAPVVVEVAGEGFAINQARQEIEVPPRGNTATLSFELTATTALGGKRAAVRVTVSRREANRTIVLGQVSLRTQVAAVAEPVPAGVPTAPLWAVTSAVLPGVGSPLLADTGGASSDAMRGRGSGGRRGGGGGGRGGGGRGRGRGGGGRGPIWRQGGGEPYRYAVGGGGWLLLLIITVVVVVVYFATR